MNNLNIASLFGGCDTLFKTFLIFIIIDYISGLLQAIYNKKLNSKIGAKGIIKKIGYILIVIVTSSIDIIYNINIRSAILYMFITNEGLSIIENLSQINIIIPDILKDKLDRKEDNNK